MKPLLLSALVLLGHCLFGQSRLLVGPEFGWAIPQLPARYVLDSYSTGAFSSRRVEKIPLLLEPSLGVRAEWETGSRISVSAALRIQKTGNKFKHISKTRFHEGSQYNLRSTYQLIFHEAIMPITVGYQFFRTKKIPLTLSAGIQPSWMARARREVKLTRFHTPNRILGEDKETIDFLNDTNPGYLLNRFQARLHLAVSAKVNEKWRLYLQYELGRAIPIRANIGEVQLPLWCDCEEPFRGVIYQPNGISVTAARWF